MGMKGRSLFVVALLGACGGPVGGGGVADADDDGDGAMDDTGDGTSGAEGGESTGAIDKPESPQMWKIRAAQTLCGSLYACAAECSHYPDYDTCEDEWIQFMGNLEQVLRDLQDERGVTITIHPECLSRFELEAEAMGCQTAVEYYPGLYDAACDPGQCRLLHGDKQEGEVCTVAGLPQTDPVRLGGFLVEPISDCDTGLQCGVPAWQEVPPGEQFPPRCRPLCPERLEDGDACVANSRSNAPTIYPPTAIPDEVGGVFPATTALCAKGSWCDPVTDTCTARPAGGDPCAINGTASEIYCPQGMFCEQATACRPLLAEGECVSPVLCGSDECTGDQCTPLPPEICSYAGLYPYGSNEELCDWSRRYCGWWVYADEYLNTDE